MYRPFRDNCILKLVERNRKTTGGIHLPDTAGSQIGRGLIEAEVLDVGPGGFDEDGNHWAMEVSQGDRVLVRDDAGEVVVVGVDIRPQSAPEHEAGTELRVVRCAEIMAIVG